MPTQKGKRLTSEAQSGTASRFNTHFAPRSFFVSMHVVNCFPRTPHITFVIASHEGLKYASLDARVLQGRRQREMIP